MIRSQKHKIFTAIVVAVFIIGSNFNTLSAHVAPQFPSCKEQTEPGDWVTADGGFHHIPGQEEPIEGSDDVYLLENTGGNFLQCLCPVNTSLQGIQTVWWNIEDDGLSQEELDEFTGNGWYLENGGDWNLIQGDQYLAKNSNYSCREAEPTPTPIQTPGPTATPTPTNTPQPKATSTPDDGPKIRCVNLEANPQEGPSPLTVNFTAHVDNPHGGWKEFKFSFDDISSGQPREWTTTERHASHRYEKEGTFIATVIARADNGQWYGGDDCMKFIEVDDSKVLGAKDDKVLPATGVDLLLILTGLSAAGFIGRYLYRRFRLV